LTIFAEAGLAGEVQGRWELDPKPATIDLTTTRAWSLFSLQLEEYRKWLKGFTSQPLERFLA